MSNQHPALARGEMPPQVKRMEEHPPVFVFDGLESETDVERMFFDVARDLNQVRDMVGEHIGRLQHALNERQIGLVEFLEHPILVERETHSSKDRIVEWLLGYGVHNGQWGYLTMRNQYIAATPDDTDGDFARGEFQGVTRGRLLDAPFEVRLSALTRLSALHRILLIVAQQKTAAIKQSIEAKHPKV